MQYSVQRIGDRIIHIPDQELEDALAVRRKRIKRFMKCFLSEISVFGRKDGLRRFLSRHSGGRFFIIVDFVHAFHKITKRMAVEALPGIGESFFDRCFVKMGRQEVIPVGFSTSSYIFEIFMRRTIDIDLVRWAGKHKGKVTCSADNILVTWRKNTPEALQELRQIFEPFEVRFTPKMPRKWQEPIRFCGLVLFKKDRPKISRRRRKRLMEKSSRKRQDGDFKSAQGIMQFVHLWT